jgi:heme exporter protein D
MMPEATHTGFIVAAYAATVIVVVGLCLWVMLDYRAQRRSLADLERRGIARRSAGLRPEPSQKKAREKV